MDFIWHDPKAPKMAVHEAPGSVVWLSFPALDAVPWLTNAYSTRLGGVSHGDVAAMNFRHTGESDLENIRRNFQIIAEAAGFPFEGIIRSQQTHTTNVLKVTRANRGDGVVRDLPWTDVDGFITNEPGCVLATFYADCVPLYFVDPVHRAIGLSHSGWRGTAAGMGRVTLEAMAREYGTDPADVIAAIGPSISQANYEVSQEVAEAFDPAFSYRKENGKYQLDLWAANKAIMVAAGVREENISLSNLCTFENHDLLHSHRATGGRRGTNGAFLAIKE